MPFAPPSVTIENPSKLNASRFSREQRQILSSVFFFFFFIRLYSSRREGASAQETLKIGSRTTLAHALNCSLGVVKKGTAALCHSGAGGRTSREWTVNIFSSFANVSITECLVKFSSVWIFGICSSLI